MNQFHYREIFKPLKPCKVTCAFKRKAMVYLMFLKMKLNREIKARGYTYGRPQRIYKTKEETSSPTVAVDLIFITFAK